MQRKLLDGGGVGDAEHLQQLDSSAWVRECVIDGDADVSLADNRTSRRSHDDIGGVDGLPGGRLKIILDASGHPALNLGVVAIFKCHIGGGDAGPFASGGDQVVLKEAVDAQRGDKAEEQREHNDSKNGFDDGLSRLF